ncbi:MAG: homoserine dehydrogenase [Puniceicoccales bacterium]|jgi:homoserine dehydrogenase|nr:homoserine dehydrogenase [Puniceicoccales bacterium]
MSTNSASAAGANTAAPLKIGLGIIGFGTVGQGVWKHLAASRRDMEARLGASIELVGVCVRDPDKPRAVAIPRAKISTDPLALVDNPRVNIVCELMGGTGAACDVTLRALRAGKVVVSANKALISARGAEIFKAVSRFGGQFLFEASVAGGVPVIKSLREGLVANRFPEITGIVNGTCNYLLTRMEREGLSYEAVLRDARKLGYVEADESLDLDGVDAFQKAVILAFLAHGKWVPRNKTLVEGIRAVTLEDIQRARDFGYRIKHLAVIRRDFARGLMTLGAYPALVPLDSILARVDGVHNGISLTGDVVGTTTLIGRGAGQDATASAVIGDIVDAIRTLKGSAFKFLSSADLDSYDTLGATVRMAELEEIHTSFYLRFLLRDVPGVSAEVYRVFAEEGISVARVVQYANPGTRTGTHTLSTYPVTEAAMARALRRIRSLRTVLGPPLALRIVETRE